MAVALVAAFRKALRAYPNRCWGAAQRRWRRARSAAHGFAARTSAEVVNEIFFKCGASAADENNRVQRFWRDANAAALHPSIDWDTLSALYGMQQLGLQPQGIF